MLDSLWSREGLRNGSELLDLTHFCAHFFEEQNDLRYLLFLHCSLFNLHLKKQYSIFHSVASWCCDSFPVALWVAPFALFPVFTLAFPSQPFPGSLPLGSAWIKKWTQKGDHVQILTGSQDRSPLQKQSAWKAAIVPLILLSSLDCWLSAPRPREEGMWKVVVEECAEVIQGGVAGGVGGLTGGTTQSRGWEKLPHRRPEATTGEQRFQAVVSRGGVITSVSTLRKCQSLKASKWAECMWFPAERVPKLSINWGLEASYLRFTFHFITKCRSIKPPHSTYHGSFLPLGVL